ncbi:MAG: hypothetical protein GF398_01730 [Chitinivibrionales bacterium]|nr:hypothetical protein [Chitinivibrionales bacterium]
MPHVKEILMNKLPVILLSILAVALPAQDAMRAAAKVTRLEGTASMMRNGGGKWRPVRPGMAVKQGDQLYTRAESFVELKYENGAVVRMDENTKVTIESATATEAETKTGIGNVWVNMKKIASGSKKFEITSPTAVAAIRGTAFTMQTDRDSSSSVSVYNGKVAVGPSDELKKWQQQQKPKPPRQEPVEVPGPEEVPGPYEVSLEAWTTIVAGQRILIRKDGKFAKESISMEQKGQSNFVQKNLKLDREM